jgi:hypothetical protein
MLAARLQLTCRLLAACRSLAAYLWSVVAWRTALHRILRKAPPTKAPNGAFLHKTKIVHLWQFVGRFGRLRFPATPPSPVHKKKTFSCMQ